MGVLRVIGLVFLGLFLATLALIIGASLTLLLTHGPNTNQTQAPPSPPTQNQAPNQG